jgi:predicted nucleic acid-binding Zn ribbon protein
MSRRGPRSIADVLQSSNISRLKATAIERRTLAGRVRSELARPEADHVVGAHIDDNGQLVISMDSAAWAARLRYTTPQLLGKTVRATVAARGAPQPKTGQES